jgi:hypothetical protein
MSVYDSFDELAKTQKVRVFDIYFLGPFLLYAATRKTPLSKWTKRTLFVAGCMTMVYNWSKYKSIKEDLTKAVSSVQ